MQTFFIYLLISLFPLLLALRSLQVSFPGSFAVSLFFSLPLLIHTETPLFFSITLSWFFSLSLYLFYKTKPEPITANRHKTTMLTIYP